ncbi:hypothetical protein ACOSP7_000810 [Xanthoceras sorbifolium]
MAECDQIVKNNWGFLVAPVRLGGVCDNIRRCTASLGSWNATNRASLRRSINTKRLELASLNQSVSSASWRDIRLVEKELDDLLLQEEIYWRQRSRVSWLKFGDRNSKFFHAKASARRKSNEILGLSDDMGCWHSDSASGAWNSELVRSSFAPIDADCILSLPTSMRSCPDKLLWHYSKDGKYSVKSGYWLASSLAQDGASSSSSSAGSSWWKFLWGLNILAKVRMFVWRACRNLLPTRSLLAARRVLGGSGSLVEPKAAVPFLAGLRLPTTGSFFDFILACFSRLLVHEMELLLVLLWRFWFRRNRTVHSAPLLSVEDTVDWSKMFLADFQAVVAVPSVRCGLVAERWLAPSPGWVKINSDVAVDVRGRRLGFGVVFRDFAGKVLVSYTSLLLGLFSSDIGEALAILYGLRLAVDLGLFSVCVESDAASIVKQLSSRDSPCSDIGLILDDILSLAVNLSSISFLSVRRCANKVAHGLAKLALWHQPVGVQFGDVPSSLALLVVDDSRGLL